MKLSEFIKKRLEELGIKRSNLINDYDLAWSTLSNIDHDKPINKVTQEKLAKALQCSQGDIQACMAEQNPLKKVVVNKKSLAKMKKTEDEVVEKVIKEKPYVTPAPDPEEPAEVFQQDAEPEDDEEQAEYTLSEVKTFEQMALNDYKQHLRELAWRIFLSGVPGTHTMENIYADIGYALVQELGIKNKGGDTE